jgi:hypothetical protein
MNENDLIALAYIPSIKKYFPVNTVFDIPFTIPSTFEGAKNTKSFTFNHPAMIGPGKITSLTEVGPGTDMPVSNSNDNARIEKLHLSIATDQASLNVKRTSTLKGFNKIDVQTNLMLYEDFIEYEYKAFNEKKTFLQEIADEKGSKKYMQEVINAFAEARKKQKDAFIEEAKNWFEQDITELNDYKIDNPGVRHTAPDFTYSSTFNMSGLIKKAGNNMIVEIGKIQGNPLVIKEEQKKRDLDVYLPYARSIEYIIELDIPEGYTAEGVDALNSKTGNETGYFITEASTNGKTVSIKIRKHYLHNFETAKNFEKIVAFVNASSEWTNAKLLLKKK